MIAATDRADAAPLFPRGAALRDNAGVNNEPQAAMKAFLIDPAQRSIAAIDIDGTAAIAAAIGFPSIDSDEIDDDGHRLFFDESCFIRAIEGAGRFQFDRLAPVQGKGMVVRTAADGKTLVDATLDAEALTRRIKFL